ncbi:folylpolyglutamate synthase [Prolixibacter bellariivorans]|uniref:Dihydrofolate synthase/folylpolyglutamate synthase n=1 Tax=Prolixibacter bellariivorans TaxID=314319 RepID=A0A5M4AZF3_9BACT|nr:folylpolyglutamate synthase/dihydrofolate synthase family protein [Prolixibacter bellariivorans]GET33270.1 folylpolyglutamate synthase [Prolixibacter bellariivorans]
MDRFEATLRYLYEQLPFYQRKGPAAYKNNLDNTLALDELYGHPHRLFRSVHVAGTNGKGSVSHMLASVLQEAGYRVGLYTSPHLKDFRERIRVNGVKIPKEEVVRFVDDFMARNQLEKMEPSFFELTVAMAFDYFARERVDIAVVEVGLGGRLDSTNIITPEVSVITNISLDHVALLGNSLTEIAGEKAGIMKKGIPVVVGETMKETAPVFTERAESLGIPLRFADQLYQTGYSMASPEGKQLFNVRYNNTLRFEQLQLDLLGQYQGRNLCTALAAMDVMKERGWKISDDALYRGMEHLVKNTGLLGRWQVLGANPRIVCDTGHNEAGVREIVHQIHQTPYKKLHFVLGMVNDKDVSSVLRLLPKDAVYYFTKASIPRAMSENMLELKATDLGLKGQKYPTVVEALTAAKQHAEPDDMIFIGGSTFVVAEVL